MKLHLLLLVPLFTLSNGFMAELKGPLMEEACTGLEYADFEQCVTADESMAGFVDSEDESFVNRGGDGRKLTFCYMCPPPEHLEELSASLAVARDVVFWRKLRIRPT
jgi:hypothetical protein